MDDLDTPLPEFDLSPAEMRRLAALAASIASEHRERLDERPVFGKVGPRAGALDLPLPRRGATADEVLAFVRETVMPYPMGNSHARFFGFINATADPLGALADYLGATLNPNCWGGDHAAVHVEHRVMRWIAEIIGLPADADGILASGGSMANFVCLAAARRGMAAGNVREDGVGRDGAPRLVVYASEQVHSCVDKAVDLLGLGTRDLRKIPVDDAFRLSVPSLEAQIAADRAAGLRPAIVVGTAGTVNTGAIDPLEALADLCARERLWFHVDGAYGGMAAISPTLRPLLRGIERADSVAADPHKWLYVPYEAGAALVTRKGVLGDTFRRFPEYLASDPESPFPGPAWFAERGPELSRSFKALKVFMGLLRHGTEGYARAVERDVALARALADEVDHRPALERVAPQVLSIVNFRYRPAGVTAAEDVDRVNRRIVHRLTRDGLFFLAPTILRGRASIRVAITNFRTTRKDLVALCDAVEQVGAEMAVES
ncbi:MAG TPA: pyridoxal-dependent decarboxylase [Vicinamibacteria bacterium]|nr:pyridoxal-dependent decarboxylase [Vicinamibacteria bacterium]